MQQTLLISLNTQARDGDKTGPAVAGVRLPHEKYCLTGVGWGLKDAWDSEGEESVDESAADGPADPDNMMQMDEKAGDDEDDEGLDTMEDVFGVDEPPADGPLDEDQEMQG